MEILLKQISVYIGEKIFQKASKLTTLWVRILHTHNVTFMRFEKCNHFHSWSGQIINAETIRLTIQIKKLEISLKKFRKIRLFYNNLLHQFCYKFFTFEKIRNLRQIPISTTRSQMFPIRTYFQRFHSTACIRYGCSENF